MPQKELKENNAIVENTQRPVGRPTLYNNELVDRICSLISQGKSMRSVCLLEEMPEMETVWRWLRENPYFNEQYVRATQDRTETQLELLNELGDTAIELSQSTDPKQSNAVVQAVKLKADNLKWVMSKMKPKKYGDKLELAGDQDNPLTIELVSYATRKPIEIESKDITDGA